MAVDSWKLAGFGAVLSLLGAVYLILWSGVEILASGAAAGQAIGIGFAGVVVFVVAALVALAPAGLLAFERTQWLGVVVATILAVAFLSIGLDVAVEPAWPRLVFLLNGGLLVAGSLKGIHDVLHTWTSKPQAG